MTVNIYEAKEAELHHDARGEDRRRLGVYRLPEDLPAGLRRIELDLELGRSIEVQADARQACEQEEQHQDLKRPDVAGVRPNEMPPYHAERKPEEAQGRELPGSLVVLEEEQIHARASQAEDEQREHLS